MAWLTEAAALIIIAGKCHCRAKPRDCSPRAAVDGTIGRGQVDEHGDFLTGHEAHAVCASHDAALATSSISLRSTSKPLR
jgi:hypothetical protein